MYFKGKERHQITILASFIFMTFLNNRFLSGKKSENFFASSHFIKLSHVSCLTKLSHTASRGMPPGKTFEGIVN